MTARDIPIVGLGFTTEFSPWAGDFVDDCDWPAIRSDYNDRLKALAPEGVLWGWSEAGPWCVADVTLDADEVRQAWVEAVGGGDWDPFIDFESIAARHETGAVVELHETDACHEVKVYSTIDDSDIEALRQEAGQAGDYSMAAMCAVALGQRDYWDDVEDAGQDPYRAALTDLGWMTQTDARTECARVIRQTRAELAE